MLLKSGAAVCPLIVAAKFSKLTFPYSVAAAGVGSTPRLGMLTGGIGIGMGMGRGGVGFGRRSS